MLMNNPVFFRKSLCHIITVAMLVSLLGSFCMVNAADSYGYSKVCRVTASTLNVRKGAGDTYTKLGMLKKGTYKVILSSKKDKKELHGTRYTIQVPKQVIYVLSTLT